MLVMARPDLLDERPAWGGGKPNAATISLEPLSVEECDGLIANLLGRAALPDEARTRILKAAEGTPLFVEEMLSMLIDDGLLVRGDHDWTAVGDLSTVPVPATVQALLAARLDRLGAEERAVIEHASVAGQQFHVGALEAMSAGRSLDVRTALRGLVRRDLIGPDRSLLAGDNAFRFRHLLIRDAAYEAILKSARAELHARFAEWLERVAGDRIEEQEEILGYHLERAHRLHADLGPIDDATKGLGLRAAAHLGASGRRASERGDVAAAANLFQRATDLLPVGSAERPQLLYELGGAMIQVGDVRLSFSASEQASTEAAAAGQKSLHWLARIQRTGAHALMEPHAVSTEDVRAELDEAIRVFEGLGDEAGLANAWLGLCDLEWMPCRFEDAELAAERAAEHARRAGDRRLLERALVRRSAAQYFDATPPGEMLEAVGTAVEEIGGTTGFRFLATAARGLCLAWRDDLDGARRLLDEADAIAEALGSSEMLMSSLECRGDVEFLADIAAAERAFREYYRLTDELGDEGHKSTAAGHLARALAHLGRFEEAESYARIAIEAAAEDDLASQVLGRAAQARVLSAQGRHDEAISLAREAMEMFADAQMSSSQGDVCMELAEVLRAAGRPAEAAEAARSGLGHYERKRSVPSTKAARAFLASLGGETRPSRT
jgi:tetratricopeptide (TPR) repeat protein